MTDLLAQARKVARRQDRIAAGTFAATLVFLAMALFCGCASVQTPQGRALVLQEPPGGCVAVALERANISAITLPGMPPVVFDTREDPCRLEHEFEHKRQQRAYGAGLAGELAWGADYTAQFVACLPRALAADHMFGAQSCYLGITWEVQARAVQDACAAHQAGGP